MSSTRVGEKIGNSRWLRVGFMMFILYLIAFADRTNIGVAAPQIAKDLGYSPQIIGTLLSAFFWGYVLTQFPGGILASRFGAVRMIGIAMILTGIAGCLTGYVGNFWGIVAARVLMGLAEGVIFPSFPILFIRWFPGHERARATATALYAMPISAVLMAPLAGWMIDHLGWPAMFVWQGGPAIVVGILFMMFVSDDPADDRWIGEAERAYILKGRNLGVKADDTLMSVLTRPTVWILALASLAWIMVIYSFGLWMPSLIKQYFPTGYSAVGWLTAIPFLFGGISMYVNSRLSDQTSGSRGWFVAVPLVVAGIALLAEHYGPGGLVWTISMFTIVGAGLFSGSGTWWTYAISLFPRNQASPCIGVMNIFASFGGIVGPFVVGLVAAGGNLSGSLYFLGYSLFVAAFLIVVLIMMEQRSRSAVVAA